MNKAELCALLKRLDVHPSRKLGQNFLLDPNLLDAMVRESDIVAGQRILEIGPGTGMLTWRLLAAGGDVTAVELDHRLANYIRETSETAGKPFRLVQGDACKQDYDALMGDKPYRCIANLPYSCSSPFLMHIMEAKNPPQDMYVLLQKEMADRLSALQGTKEYGVLTVRLAMRYQAAVVRVIPPVVFFPQPVVQSVFLRLSPVANPATAEEYRLVSQIAATVFAQRRKKAFRLLSRCFSEASMHEAFAKLGISEEVRAEGLAPEQYRALANSLDTARKRGATAE